MCIVSISRNSEYSFRYFFFFARASVVLVCRELHLRYIMGKIGLSKPAIVSMGKCVQNSR